MSCLLHGCLSRLAFCSDSFLSFFFSLFFLFFCFLLSSVGTWRYSLITSLMDLLGPSP